jgi:tetratricopeptide repeat protein 30
MQACGTAAGGAGAGGAAATEKYKECIRLYGPVVAKYLPGGAKGEEGSASGNILDDVTAIVLANLCVAYIVTDNNDEAQRVMVCVEAAEEAKLAAEAAAGQAAAAGGKASSSAPKPLPCFHLSIINLVIGTLYCAKGNTEFGVTRVLRALEPPQRKLGPDTWYYCKRALLHLGLVLAKGMVVITDATFGDVLASLDAAELHGARIPAEVLPPNSAAGEVPRTIAIEARALKRLFLRLREKS